MKKVIYANYDWDDNIIYMPTRIVFFSKNPKCPIKELEVPTDVFAKVRSKVGLESGKLFLTQNSDGVYVGSLEEKSDSNQSTMMFVDLKDYEINNDDQTGSFRQFRDCEKNYFLRDLKIAIDNKTFGPSFKDLQEHCSTEEEASNLCIITARGHHPQTILNGLKLLQSLGYIKHTPKLENIFPCSYKGLDSKLVASAQNPSDAKKNIILSILDGIQNKVNCLKTSAKKRYTFGFSDDDQKTMKIVESSLKEQIQTGRWNNIEINLYFTGNHIKERHTLLYSQNEIKAA